MKSESGFFADGSKMITDTNKIDSMNDLTLQLEPLPQIITSDSLQMNIENENKLNDKQQVEHRFNYDLLVKEGFSPVQADAIQSLVKESIESG